MSRSVTPALALAAALVAAAPVVGAAAEPPRRTSDLVAKGKALYEANCVACHGEKGEGDGPAAASLDPKPRNLTARPIAGGPKAIFKVLATGKPGTAMIAFTHLTEEERWALSYFVDELSTSSRSSRPGSR